MIKSFVLGILVLTLVGCSAPTGMRKITAWGLWAVPLGSPIGVGYWHSEHGIGVLSEESDKPHLPTATDKALALGGGPALKPHGNLYQGFVREVKDGDTLTVLIVVWPQQIIETSIRLRGVDAPELRAGCSAELALAEKAAEFVQEVVSDNAYLVEITDIDFDKYGGRYDASVWVGGEDLGEMLVAAGLARYYSGRGKRKDWCATEPEAKESHRF